MDRLLGVCRIDYSHSELVPEGTDAEYMQSLDKVKYFPNESFIFPGHVAKHEDLLFSKAILSSDPSTSKAAVLI